ncbi:MAG: ATP-binding protein [Verrucomicrobiota bacterium]
MDYRRFDFKLLEEAIRGTSARFGEDYFRYCVEVLCKSFQMDLGFIARLDSETKENVTTLSVFGVKEGYLDNFSFPLSETPCGKIYKQNQILCYPFQVQKKFPCCSLLGELEVQGYLGIPIPDEKGAACGHICLLGHSKVPAPCEIEQLFLHSFASRTGAEFRRTDMEAELIESRDEAEVASEAKSRFLANMSHELRTPLNAVLGYSQLLALAEQLDADSMSHVEAINRNGKHLLSLINGVLDMSHIERSHIEVNFEEASLAQINRDIELMFQPTDNSGNSCCQTDFDPELPSSVYTDPAKVRQIVANLLSNAFKYCSRDEVGYAVKLTPPNEADKRWIEFTISDRGPGIPAHELELIFQPFERATNTENATIPGTGLGLAIARTLAQSINGEIIVHSEVGKGSSFHFRIPAKNTRHLQKPSKADQSPLPSSKPSILVVDDNLESRNIVRQVLSREGYQILEAEDGENAVKSCLTHQPHLILMDVRMPVLSGPEATLKIREKLGSQTPPIIGLTGDLLEARDKENKLSAFDDVIGKPFEFTTLLETVERHLHLPAV